MNPSRPLALTGVLAPAALAAPSFTGLGSSAGGSSSAAHGISVDGSTIVGYSISANGTEVFRWQSGAMVGPGDRRAGASATMPGAFPPTAR